MAHGGVGRAAKDAFLSRMRIEILDRILLL
jgi:hypothetical protein